MKDKYSYLNDPRALAEIRKHKWLESQKAGYEVGFATAAVDWIKKYGLEWRTLYAQETENGAEFLEKRRYRRFNLSGVVELIKKHGALFVEGVNFNLFGLLCRTTEFMPMGTMVEGYMNPERNNQRVLKFQGVIDRVAPIKFKRFEIFFKFDELSQRQIGSWTQLSG